MRTKRITALQYIAIMAKIYQREIDNIKESFSVTKKRDTGISINAIL